MAAYYDRNDHTGCRAPGFSVFPNAGARAISGAVSSLPQAANAARPARDLARTILERYDAFVGSRRLIPITRAHIDGCLYHGPASLDFVRAMVNSGAKVTVPTTLNVGAIDLLHPQLFRGRPEIIEAGRAMMHEYTALGCRQTWTCAPYQLADRPNFGEQIAWAESNAIVFANSVLGARTERYGDFIDLCAAVVGMVPEVGLHTDEGRLGRVLVRVHGISDRAMARDAFFAALGHLVGLRAGTAIPVIDGVPSASEDHLKALGAAAASSGAVAMFHMVGVTPEAPTRDAAFGGRAPTHVIDLGPDDFRGAMRDLTSTGETALGAVSIGTPHFSYDEFTQLRALLAGRRVHERLEFFVSTGRDILARLDDEGWGAALRAQGVQVVTDTCTYLSPVLTGRPGAVMTNSAKWAWYAPNNLGYQVAFGSLEECVESAVRGEVWRDDAIWEASPAVSGVTLGVGTVASSAPPAREEDAVSNDAIAPSSAVVLPPELSALASAEVLVLDEPLSFWGGVDEETGVIIDTHHPQHGASIAGKVLVMPGGRGSSSSSSVLAELIRGQVAPAAIVLRTTDPILALGAIVAEALYDRAVPVVVHP